MKLSQNSFNSFGKNGDFLFETTKCDFSELQMQLDNDKETPFNINKFDFCQLVQQQENIDEFPAILSQFIEVNKNIEKIGSIIVK